MRTSKTPKLRVQPDQPQSQGHVPGRLETCMHIFLEIKTLTSYLLVHVHGKGLHVVDMHILVALHGMAVTYMHPNSKTKLVHLDGYIF